MAGVLAELVAQVQVITDRDVHELPLLTYGEVGVRLGGKLGSGLSY